MALEESAGCGGVELDAARLILELLEAVAPRLEHVVELAPELLVDTASVVVEDRLESHLLAQPAEDPPLFAALGLRFHDAISPLHPGPILQPESVQVEVLTLE